MRFLSIFLYFSSLAAAAPTDAQKPPGPDPRLAAQERVKTMAAELRRGRALANKNQHAEAVKAFDAALRAVPDEPRVLNELGFSLRAAGDLARAEEICKKAAQTKEPPLRAPALYNLGRVLEQRNDKAGAIAAYSESLKLRENKTVRERLLSLDPTAASDRTRPQPLDGPVASIDAWCKAQKDEECHLDGGAISFQHNKPIAPWKEMRLFTIGDSPEMCVLAVRTTRGWFAGKLLSCRESEFRHGVQSDVDMGARLILSFTGTDSMRDYDEELGHSYCCIDADFEAVIACGVGPSGVPHCTPEIDLAPPLEALKGTSDTKLVAKWTNDELVLERADGKSADERKPRLAPTLRAIAGRHRIVFP
jgi:tetratricopeptide (TPR) repeat protein